MNRRRNFLELQYTRSCSKARRKRLENLGSIELYQNLFEIIPRTASGVKGSFMANDSMNHFVGSMSKYFRFKRHLIGFDGDRMFSVVGLHKIHNGNTSLGRFISGCVHGFPVGTIGLLILPMK